MTSNIPEETGQTEAIYQRTVHDPLTVSFLRSRKERVLKILGLKSRVVRPDDGSLERDHQFPHPSGP